MARSRACAPALLLLLALAALGTVPRLADATGACVEDTPGWTYDKVLQLITSTIHSCSGGGTRELLRTIQLTKNGNGTVTYFANVVLPPPAGNCSGEVQVVDFTGNIPIPPGFSFTITPGGKKVSVLGTLSNLCVPNAAGTNPCASKASLIFTQASSAYCLPRTLFKGSFLTDYFTYQNYRNQTSCAYEEEVANDFTAFIKLGGKTYRLSDKPLFECNAFRTTGAPGRRLVEGGPGSAASSADGDARALLPAAAAAASPLGQQRLADRSRSRRLAGRDRLSGVREAMRLSRHSAASNVGGAGARRQLRASGVPVTSISKYNFISVNSPRPPEDQIKECKTRRSSIFAQLGTDNGESYWLVDFFEGYLEPNETCFDDPTSTRGSIFLPVANVTGTVSIVPPTKLGEPVRANGTLSTKEGCPDFGPDVVCNIPITVTFSNFKAACADGQLYKSRDYSQREDRYTRVISGTFCEEGTGTGGKATVKVGSKTFTITGAATRVRFEKSADVVTTYNG